jgi:DNA-binding Xre family transcriptional regulator
MIRGNLDTLRRQKAAREDRDLPLSAVAAETGVSTNALLRLRDFGTGADWKNDRLQASTINTLCNYFGVGVGELIVWEADAFQEQKEESHA